MRRLRVIDTAAHQVTEFASTAQFLNSGELPAGILTVNDVGIPIDILVSPSGSPTTIFFFHGAIQSHFTIPVLSGLGISGGLEANRVFISDPSLLLDSSLMLSWYAGNYRQPQLQSTLLQMIRKIANDLNSERLVFFGGSGGGFAALFYAHHFQNSLALIFNPQTNIANYDRTSVSNFTEKAFNLRPSPSAPLEGIPHSIVYNLCELYRSPTSAKVAYIQNANDTAHIDFHLKPFIGSIHSDVELLTLIEPWRSGHTPPPKGLLHELLDTSVCTREWSTALTHLGFRYPQECSAFHDG